MSRLRYLKDIKPGELSFKRLWDALVVRIKDIPHAIAWRFNLGIARENKHKLSAYRDIHKGRRCFILANGPSLRKADLSHLKNEITIGMNRMYLSEKELGFVPSYIVVHDIRIQLQQFRDDLNQLKIPKFFNWNARTSFRFQ